VRTPLIAANWKMHKTIAETRAFAADLLPRIHAVDGVEVSIAPAFTALTALRDALAGSPVAVCAQDVHPEAQGAFTGEISAGMLADTGCRYVIVGHSERRQMFGDTNEFVARKLAAVQAGGMIPILCVGETLAERESGRTFEVVGGQLDGSLALADAGKAAELVVAYEPVWAIGTGRTATPEIAQEAHAFIRGSLSKRFGSDAQSIRILYGGSVKPDNAEALLAQDDIDGGLVGGASLDPASFSAIIRFRDSGSEG
jgi:triosephosphate isomerase